MSTLFTFIGFLAGALTTGAFLPQVFHTYRCKSAVEISWTMLVAFNLGVVFWFIYGVYLHSWPMILANAITLMLQAFIIGMKIRYSRPSPGSCTNNSFAPQSPRE